MKNKEIIYSFLTNDNVSWKKSVQSKSLKCFYYNKCRILLNDYGNVIAVIKPESRIIIHCMALDKLLDRYELRKTMKECGYSLGGLLATPTEMENIIFSNK